MISRSWGVTVRPRQKMSSLTEAAAAAAAAAEGRYSHYDSLTVMIS